jgi:uncharacterized protein (DUF1800 family)
MHRSIALASIVLLPAAAAQSGTPPTQASTPRPIAAAASAAPREQLPDEQIQQVLNRLAFGPRPGDAAAVRAMGVDKWIDLQLHPEGIDDGATDALMAHYPIYQMSTPDIVHDFTVVRQLQRQVKKEAGADSANKQDARREAVADNPQLAQAVRESRQMVGEVQSAELARAVSSNRQLEEVMVDFWENHFSVYAGKGQTRLFLAAYDRDAIRPRALGKFRDLLEAVAKSPAMLFFLDNWESVADSTHHTLAPAQFAQGRFALGRFGRGRLGPMRRPVQQGQQANAQQRPKRGVNENYGRELMELHTLGVDGGYTQKDVQEVARAFTGWTFNRQTGAFVFNPRVHDADPKVILGHKFPAGRGIEDGEEVLDILATSPATAHFITTKLARHFVSDNPPKALVDRCANEFTKTDGDIRETLRCIVTSPEFFSRAAFRAKVKTPFEVVASGLRAIGAQPDTTPRTAQLVARLGEPIFGRQTPDGWPDRGDAWMNTGAILNRINFGLALASGRLPGAALANWPVLDSLRGMTRPEQVDGVINAVLGGDVSPETRQVLMSGDNPMMAKGTPDDSVMSAMAPDAASGRAGGKGGGKGGFKGRGADAGGAMLARPVDLQGVAQVLGLALGAPEFQRR